MNGTSMASNSSPTVSLGFLLVRSCSAMMSFTLLICCSAQRPKDNEQSQNEQLSHCRQNCLTCAFTSFTVNGVNLHFLSEVQPPQEQDNLKSMGRSIFGKALTLIPSSRGNLQSSLEHCNKSCPVESLSFALKTIICSVSVRLNINHVIAIKLSSCIPIQSSILLDSLDPSRTSRS